MEEKCGILFKTVKSERYIKGFQLQKQKTKKERETEREKNEIKLPPFLFIQGKEDVAIATATRYLNLS